MKTLLFLSSYGDFTIAIFVLKNALQTGAFPKDLNLVASSHLQSLYDDLLKEDPELGKLPLQFEDFGIRRKILAILTNKHFFSNHSMAELFSLRAFVSKHSRSESKWFVEQKRRASWLSTALGKAVRPVHSSGNVYDSYAGFTGINSEMLEGATGALKDKPSILILPESRKKSKTMQPALVRQIAETCLQKGCKVNTAFFKSIPYQAPGEQSTHVAFSDLIQLIRSADLVITADSLPAHLSQYLQKPHLVVYAQKQNGEWLTPIARRNAMFTTFRDVQSDLQRLLFGKRNNSETTVPTTRTIA